MTKFSKEMFLSIQIFPLNQILEEIEYLKHFHTNHSLVFTLCNFYKKALLLIHSFIQIEGVQLFLLYRQICDIDTIVVINK